MADAAPEPIITAAIPPKPRRVSSVGQTAVLRHPSPAGAGTYSRNISRLERSAEEISQAGSDVAEEIRKMQEISRRSSSESASRASDLHAHHPRRVSSARSRTNSRSIVDLNGNARWGGYSPGAFVASPTGSVRSHGSWTQASVHRVASNPKASRLVMVEPLQEGRPLDSPLAPSSASMYSQEQQVSRRASQSSFSRRYDAIAHQIEESLQAVPPTPTQHNGPAHDDAAQYHHPDPYERPRSADTFQEAQLAFKDFDGVHFDPDREEFVALDEEGHEIRRVSARSSSGTLLDAASMLWTARMDRPISYGVPPPSENMVYYPAPVPRMLNLPKRLSQQPPAHIQAKRRTQMLSELSAGARQSAPWIPPVTFGEDGHPMQQFEPGQNGTRSYRSGSGSTNDPEHPRGMLNQRMSMANPSSLPQHLRASLFFQHQSVPHDVEVKSESAVATLDSILAASATAPVSAFTHHPYAGDVHKAVYAQERSHHQRRSTATTLATAISDKDKSKQVKKRRSSSIGKLFRRKSFDLLAEDDDTGKTYRPGSRGSSFALNEAENRIQKRRSRMSLGGELDDDEEPTERARRRHTGLGSGLVGQAQNSTLHEGELPSGSRPMTTMSQPLTDAEQIEADFREQEKQDYDDLEDDDDPVFAQPTTLLAELQVRKAQLKSRNKTAATAFPGGMHSTLLQLDAVEQINAKKRQKQRIQLAWEDPHLRAEEDAMNNDVDENVPLGVLFPSKDGLVNPKLGDARDWDRPLGLMARRELEDNEPLSKRRNRLYPNARSLKPEQSQVNLFQSDDITDAQDGHDDAGETLGQRLRRLKTKEAPGSAISNVITADGERPVSTFSASVFDEFPELKINDKDQENPDSKESRKSRQVTPGVDEGETLGQRRARLQREREASGQGDKPAAVRPPLTTSNSLADLLSSNPIGQRAALGKKEAAPGTLLHSASQNQLKHRQDLLAANMRSSSHNLLDTPLVDDRAQASGEPQTGLLAAERSRPANGAYSGRAGGVADPLFHARPANIGGLLGAQQSRPTNGAFAGGVYNTALAGAGLGFPTRMTGMQGNSPYFASPTAGLAYNGYAGNNMMGVQIPHQPSTINTSTYYALHGGPTYMTPPMPTQSAFHPMAGVSAMGNGTYAYSAQQQMGVGMDPASLDPNQRAAIDQWRMGVAQ